MLNLSEGEKTINIISFDVPFPANYGGVIDVFYTLRELNKLGIKIILHCFSKGRILTSEVTDLCHQVFVYERNMSVLNQFSFLPFTVKSRQSNALKNNLLKNDFPILFETLHACALLNDKDFKTRIKIYRHSNIEHTYYYELANADSNFFKKIYFYFEAIKLFFFENRLKSANAILTVNTKDAMYFQRKFPKSKTEFLPSFHQNSEISFHQNPESKVLFHANLSVAENVKALRWLCKNVISKSKQNFVVAGLKPSKKLSQYLSEFPNVELHSNPSENQMNVLMQRSKVHILLTFQPTGLKLKLLNSLHTASYIICNPQMLEGTGIAANESIASLTEKEDFLTKIDEFINSKAWNSLELENRRKILAGFNNEINALKLIDIALKGNNK